MPHAAAAPATVEAALVLPVVITFLFGILEYGRYVMMLQMLTNAAREGARYAVTHTNPITIAGVDLRQRHERRDERRQQGAGRHSSSAARTSRFTRRISLGNNLGTWTNTQVGQSICVRITGNYPVILGKMLFLPSTRFRSSRSAVMRSESN